MTEIDHTKARIYVSDDDIDPGAKVCLGCYVSYTGPNGCPGCGNNKFKTVKELKRIINVAPDENTRIGELLGDNMMQRMMRTSEGLSRDTLREYIGHVGSTDIRSLSGTMEPVSFDADAIQTLASPGDNNPCAICPLNGNDHCSGEFEHVYEDAYSDEDRVCCDERCPQRGYISCTRPPGHEGPHEAGGAHPNSLGLWGQPFDDHLNMPGNENLPMCLERGTQMEDGGMAVCTRPSEHQGPHQSYTNHTNTINHTWRRIESGTPTIHICAPCPHYSGGECTGSRDDIWSQRHDRAFQDIFEGHAPGTHHCGERCGGEWICTRADGHDGSHEAHLSGGAIARWGEE